MITIQLDAVNIEVQEVMGWPAIQIADGVPHLPSR